MARQNHTFLGKVTVGRFPSDGIMHSQALKPVKSCQVTVHDELISTTLLGQGGRSQPQPQFLKQRQAVLNPRRTKTALEVAKLVNGDVEH